MRNKIIFISLIFYFLSLSSAFSVNFKDYLELSACVDEYNSFTGYKNKLNECFKNQGIEVNKDSFKIIEKKSGIKFINNNIKIFFNNNWFSSFNWSSIYASLQHYLNN